MNAPSRARGPDCENCTSRWRRFQRRDMKIGYICSDFDIPLYGHEGCSVRIREFTNALVEQGHDAFLLCAELGEPTSVKARVIELRHSPLNSLLFRTIDDETVWSQQPERDPRLIMHNLWLQGEPSSI